MRRSEAEQIAALLNERNQLTVQYDASRVLAEADKYVYRALNHRVIACVEVKHVQWYQAEILHLTVQKDFEGQGHARRLLEDALDRAKSNGARVAQATIREGNEASEELFLRSGFVRVCRFNNSQSGNNVSIWQKVLSPAL